MHCSILVDDVFCRQEAELSNVSVPLCAFFKKQECWSHFLCGVTQNVHNKSIIYVFELLVPAGEKPLNLVL